MPARAEIEPMFSSIAKRYDIANTAISFGQHFVWRKKLISLLGDIAPKDVVYALDLCTGTGDFVKPLSNLAKQVIAIDFCKEMLHAGRVADKFTQTTTIIHGDGLAIPLKPNLCQIITVAFGLRNYADLARGIREITRVLSTNGVVAILEAGVPQNRFIRFGFDIYAKHLLPYIGGLITGNRSAYTYLPSSAAAFPSGDKFAKMVAPMGLKVIKWLPLSFGTGYLYFATKYD